MRIVLRRLRGVAIAASGVVALGALATLPATAVTHTPATDRAPSDAAYTADDLVIGLHSDDFAAADDTVGPVRAERVFFPGELPDTFSGSRADRYPDNVVVYVSYKKPGNAASFVRSIPDDKKIRLIYHHEPENDYGSDGSDFVREFQNEYHTVKNANPAIDMGMAAMTYQYDDHRNGQSGSYLPPADSVDFYAADNYQEEIIPEGLAGDPQFQGWYKLVKDRGKELVLTEYGVGATDMHASGSDRAAVIDRDDRWLTDNGRFSTWIYWDKQGTNHDWTLTDPTSQRAWRSVAKEHNAD